MEKRFESLLRARGLLRAGDSVLVAVSGGADSVALLCLLLGLRERWGLSIAVAHMDHGLRAQSAGDSDFVRDLCLRFEVPFHVREISIPDLHRPGLGGVEALARAERRRFLFDLAHQQGCSCIALGHHRDDQAETVVHRLLRGSGASGLAAMRPRSGLLIRPLLEFGRSEIRQYLASKGESFVEDESNRDLRFTRNRIRHELLPLLRDYNPRIDIHLSALADRLGVEEDFWQQQVDAWLEKSGCAAEGGLGLDVAALLELHMALRLRVLRESLRRVRGSLSGIEAVHLDSVALRLEARGDWSMDLPASVVLRSGGQLLVLRQIPALQRLEPLVMDAEGLYELSSGEWLRLSLEHAPGAKGGQFAEFDAGSCFLPFRVRGRVPGDRLRPSGMMGHKSLKDLLIEQRVPRYRRDLVPLVCFGEELLWVAGVRRCEGYWPKAGAGVWRLELVASAKT